MNKAYQMSDLEHNAFIEHCKATETYEERVIVTKAWELPEPTGEMAIEDHDNYLSSVYYDPDDEFQKGTCIKNGKIYSILETKTIKIKGYNKNAPHTTTSLTNNNVVSAGE